VRKFEDTPQTPRRAHRDEFADDTIAYRANIRRARRGRGTATHGGRASVRCRPVRQRTLLNLPPTLFRRPVGQQAQHFPGQYGPKTE